MSDEKIIEKIDKLDKISGGKEPLEKISPERVAPNSTRFDELMGSKNQSKEPLLIDGKETSPGGKPSLMDEVAALNGKSEQVKRVSHKEIIEKTNKLVAELDGIKEKLSQSDVGIKDAYKSLIKNKLTHIDENIRIALSKVGVEYTPSQKKTETKQTPIERFLGFVTDGEASLRTLGAEVQAMHLNNKEISPASMLMIQMKVGYITQEVEFFTAILNKALESTKTIMNIQV